MVALHRTAAAAVHQAVRAMYRVTACVVRIYSHSRRVDSPHNICPQIYHDRHFFVERTTKHETSTTMVEASVFGCRSMIHGIQQEQ